MIGKKQLFLKLNEETVSDIINMSGVSAKTLKIQPQVISSQVTSSTVAALRLRGPRFHLCEGALRK